MNKPAALYARVSSDRQKENHTIASQVAALMQFAETNGYLVPSEWQFQDDGFSGATLVRPGLEALRDLAGGAVTTASSSTSLLDPLESVPPSLSRSLRQDGLLTPFRFSWCPISRA